MPAAIFTDEVVSHESPGTFPGDALSACGYRPDASARMEFKRTFLCNGTYHSINSVIFHDDQFKMVSTKAMPPMTNGSPRAFFTDCVFSGDKLLGDHFSGTRPDYSGIAINPLTGRTVAVGTSLDTPAQAAIAAFWSEGGNEIMASNPKNIALRDVIWAGSQFVAVGDADGSDAYILTSADGITWTERSNPKNSGLKKLAFNGSLLVAVGSADGTDAYVLASSDGINWTECANPKNAALNAVVYGDGRFVAVGDGDGADAYVIYSEDGSTWHEAENPKNIPLNAIGYNGAGFLAGGDEDPGDQDSYLVFSPDGAQWVEVEHLSNIRINAIAGDSKRSIFFLAGSLDHKYNPYCLVGGFACSGLFHEKRHLSSLGRFPEEALPLFQWTKRSHPKSAMALHGILSGSGSNWAAFGQADGADAYLLSSPDGITWTEKPNPKNTGLNAGAFNPADGTAVFVGDADGTDAYILRTTDFYNLTVTEAANPKNLALKAVKYVPWAGFVAVGAADTEDAYILTSPDGLTWTERANPRAVQLNDITWNGSMIVAVGNNYSTDQAYIATSTDGITWMDRSSYVGNSNNLTCVIFAANKFFAYGGAWLSSPDGITWMPLTDNEKDAYRTVYIPSLGMFLQGRGDSMALSRTGTSVHQYLYHYDTGLNTPRITGFCGPQSDPSSTTNNDTGVIAVLGRLNTEGVILTSAPVCRELADAGDYGSNMMVETAELSPHFAPRAAMQLF